VRSIIGWTWALGSIGLGLGAIYALSHDQPAFAAVLTGLILILTAFLLAEVYVIWRTGQTISYWIQRYKDTKAAKLFILAFALLAVFLVLHFRGVF